MQTQSRFPVFLIVLALFAVLLAACDREPDSRELPTRFILPSETPTVPTATPTLTRTPYPTFTPTVTRSPTLTRTPTATSTPTSTFPPSMTPTPVASPTVTPSPVPTATDTPALPSILSFLASVPQAHTGTSITLSWQSTNAETALLEQLDANRAVVQSFSVVPSGQLPVTLPNAAGTATYRLTVSRGGLTDTRSVVILVTMPCAVDWFFGNQNVPENTGCPLTGPTGIVGKYQLFQGGLMFSTIINGEERVYGLNALNRRYMAATNRWDGTTVHTSTCGTAPQGTVNPQDVFNWMYHTQLGTAGLWCDPGGIGWGLAPADLAVTQTLQFESTSTAFYIQIPGYGILRISNEPGITGTWTRLAIP